MDFHPVESSVISAVGYDEEQQLLEVRFRTGRIYHYYDVAPASFQRLLTASSVGGYFNRFIRERHRQELVYDPELTHR